MHARIGCVTGFARPIRGVKPSALAAPACTMRQCSLRWIGASRELLIGRAADPQVQQFIRNQLRSQREQILRAAYDEVLRDNAEIHNYFAEQILKNTGTK